MFEQRTFACVFGLSLLFACASPPAAAIGSETAISGELAEARSAQQLTVAQAREALEGLGDVLEKRHAHAAVIGFDIEGAISVAMAQLGASDSAEPVSMNELVMLMNQVLAPIGDGHASIRVEGEARDAMRGTSDGGRAAFLPFRIKMTGEYAGDPVLAIQTDRTGFVDADHPVLESIDGVPIETWIDAASAYIPAGAPAYMRSRSLRELRDLWRWRQVLDLPDGEELRLGLASLDGSQRTVRTVEAASRPTSRLVWPERESQLLEGNIGYIRIPTMRRDPDELDDYHDLMAQFRETDGLIIDVRGNSGGRRHILNMMGGYLLSPEDDAVVYIAVRPFMVDSSPDEGLSARMRSRMAHRYIFPVGHDGWTDAQRSAVKAFRERFTGGPDDSARLEHFGDWHYAVMAGGAGGAAGHDERTYHYDAPVIVLMDEFCFSSTDNFVHAMSLIPSVTLMGRPSAASSGAPMVWNLPVEGLSARIASMASWRSNGWRFDDGRPQEPDIRADPEPTCYIGETDVVLDAAIERLKP